MKETVEIRMAGWAAMVKARNESGLTIKEWCSQNNISQTAYYYRLRQLRKAALETVDSDHTAVISESSGVPDIQFARIGTPVPQPSDIAIRIHRGNTTIEVSDHASEPVLSFLKEVLIHAV